MYAISEIFEHKKGSSQFISFFGFDLYHIQILILYKHNVYDIQNQIWVLQ